MLSALRDVPRDLLDTQVCGDDLEGAMDAVLLRAGTPSTVIATTFEPLPRALLGPGRGAKGDAEAPAPDAELTLSPEAFRDVVQVNLTHMFRIARKASLIDGTQLVLCSPDVEAGTDPHGIGFALANFIKTTLHAFTATLAVENERLVSDVPVNQINLTRRVRSEEPRNETEYLEEVKRFGHAVLLAGAPLPDAEDSRYRARIYRGMAITV
jgi:malonyl-CoA reductase/3-hydroxypropionate dehydrogenase (NADP+)